MEEILLKETKTELIKTYLGHEYPLEKLTPTNFEELIYRMFKNSLEFKEKYKYDHVSYVNGGSDKGRDVLLRKEGKVLGIIQVKHSEKIGAFSFPKARDEFIKILLYLIKENNLLPLKRKIYILAISSFLKDHDEEKIRNFKKGLETDQYDNAIKLVVKNYQKLKTEFERIGIEIETLKIKMIKIFQELEISYIYNHEIQEQIDKDDNVRQSIVPTYFDTKIIDNST